MLVPFDNFVLESVFIYFVRSGRIDIIDGKLWGNGVDSYSWYAEADDGSEGAYHLYFDNEYIDAVDTWSRLFGFSLRCLSTVLD